MFTVEVCGTQINVLVLVLVKESTLAHFWTPIVGQN